MIGVDYSFARPGVGNIKAAGFDFVCRYLASSQGKAISLAESQEILGAGLGLVLVFEDYANPQQNYNGDATATGKRDAQIALAQANAIGFPQDRPIYFAVDYDAPESSQQWIDAYLNACAFVLGGSNRVGVYGGYYIVKRCLDSGSAKWGWQTLAWSGGKIDPRTHIYQNGQTAFNGGADVDEARQPDFGQVGKGVTNMQPITPPEVDNLVGLCWGVQTTPGQPGYNATDRQNDHKNLDGKPFYEAFNVIYQDPRTFEYADKVYKALNIQLPALQQQVDKLTKQLEDAGLPTPTPTPTPDPTPTPQPSKGGKTLLVAFLAGVAAVVAYLVSLIK